MFVRELLISPENELPIQAFIARTGPNGNFESTIRYHPLLKFGVPDGEIVTGEIKLDHLRLALSGNVSNSVSYLNGNDGPF
jgi:hypothetical protein